MVTTKGRLRSEPASRLRENQNKENEICSRMKCVSLAVNHWHVVSTERS